MQVETGNTPSFFLTWWFRTSNLEPPQLESCAIDLSRTPPEAHSASHDEQQTHTDDDRDHVGGAHVADGHERAKHVHGSHQRHADEADADRAQPSIPPVDYQMFYPLSSKPIKIEDCAWAVNEQRLINIPSTIAMNNVPEHKRFKRPTRQKVIHINCFAHAMMHVEKCAPGCLELRDGLRFCLKWLKRIDEGNKVRVFHCSAQPTHWKIVASGPRMPILFLRAHRAFHCSAQPTLFNSRLRLIAHCVLRRCPATHQSWWTCFWT